MMVKRNKAFGCRAKERSAIQSLDNARNSSQLSSNHTPKSLKNMKDILDNVVLAVFKSTR